MVRWIFILALLTACTRAPQTPVLRKGNDDISRIALRGDFGLSDLRKICDAVNRDGYLDPLKRLLDRHSDEELTPFYDFLGREVFGNAHSSDGFISILKARIDRRSFSKMANSQLSLYQPYFPILSDPRIASLLPRESVFLDPDWLAIVPSWQDHFQVPEEEKAKVIAGDFRSLLSRTELASDLEMFLGNFGGMLLATLRGSREISDLLGVDAFQRVTGELDRLPLGRLLKLLSALDGPSDGLFLKIENLLGEKPELLKPLFERIEPQTAKSVLWYITKRFPNTGLSSDAMLRLPSGEPTPQFQELFKLVAGAISDVSNPILSPDDSGFFDGNRPIYLNAYAVTRYIEAVFDRWKLEGKSFSLDKLWGASVSLSDWRYKLSIDDLRRDLTTYPQFVSALELHLKQKSFSFEVGVAVDEDDSFKSLLGDLLETSQRVLPFCGPSHLIKVIAPLISSSAEVSFLRPSRWETPDLLKLLLSQVGRADYQSIQQTLDLLFNVWKVQELSPSIREQLLDWFSDKPELKRRLQVVLREMDSLSTLARRRPEVFLRLAQHLFSRDGLLSSLGALRILMESGWFEGNGKAAGRYAKDALPHIISPLHSIPPENDYRFVAPFAQAFGGEGAKLHLDFIVENLDRLPLESWLQGQFPELDGTREEAQWGRQFLRRPQSQVLLQLLTRVDRSGVERWVSALTVLRRNGHLERVLELLSFFEDSRVRRVGEVLSVWIQSGEFDQIRRLLPAS